jgi:hypothetical protein
MNTETNKNTQQIMKEIEKKTEAYVITNMSSLTSEKLVNIMSKGSDEFKQKTGRDMTYSEMREMFG